MEWFIANWQAVVQIVLAVLGAASLVAKLTPTKIDDLWIGRIINFIGLAKVVKK